MAWRPSGRAHSPGSFVLSGPFTITCGRWNRPNWLLLPPNGPGTQLLIRPKFVSSASSITDGLRRKAASSFGIESAAKETKSSAKFCSNSTASSATGACSKLCPKRCVANSNSLVFLYSICKLYFTLFFFFLFSRSSSRRFGIRKRLKTPSVLSPSLSSIPTTAAAVR